MLRAAVTIVAWNSMKYLPEALSSVAAQTFRDFTLIVVDNASTDGAADFVHANYPNAVVIRNTRNLGFARAQNQGIAYARARLRQGDDDFFILTMNPDVILMPDFLDKLLAEIEKRPDAGSAGGKLFKAFAVQDGDLAETERSDSLDSAGLRLTKARRAVERGAGDSGAAEKYNRTEEVFGVSAALALYRLDALDDVAYRGEVFDEDFFAYKEDVDLAWRLRLRGWKSLYVPDAVAFHFRVASGSERASILETIRNRSRKSSKINHLSFRNHILMLVKNEHWRNALMDSPRIMLYEIGKVVYALFCERSTIKAIPGFFRSLPRAIAKRHLIMSRAKASAGEIRKWFR